MEKDLGKMMLPFKIQQLLGIIIEKKGLVVEDALQYLYSSDLYKKLSAHSSYLWQLSSLNLYDLLKKEKQQKKRGQNNDSKVLLFYSFCLENYKSHRNITAEEALHLFAKYHVFSYLESVYDVLHTQGKEYIMDEIDEYIDNQKKK